MIWLQLRLGASCFLESRFSVVFSANRFTFSPSHNVKLGARNETRVAAAASFRAESSRTFIA
jgi:hypothetical protein